MKKKDIVIVIMLGILIVVSMVQAVQLNGVKNKLSDGSVEIVVVEEQQSKTDSNKALPKSIQDLDTMVGVC